MRGLLVIGSLLVFLGGVSCSANPSAGTNMAADLSIYLDSNYTIQWNAATQPDLSALPWKPDLDGWQIASITVYLCNTGETTLDADAENKPQDPAPGFSVSSETVTIKPGGRSPLSIIIQESPASMSGVSSDIWFNVRPAG